MAKAKGSPKTGGRKAGTPNKLTGVVKTEFEHVFTEMQADKKVNLLMWGKANPTEFYKLASKLIPADMNATFKGAVTVNGKIEFV
jgi:hypothetical protein